MKITKKIFGLLHILLFTGSFCFTALSSFAGTLHAHEQGQIRKQFVAKEDTDGCSQFLFEKIENENETENDTQIQALLLPFFVSYFQLELEESTCVLAQAPSVKYTNPIYLAVCNFRV